MPNTLFLPIRVRQWSLSAATQIASATADFGGLPYYDPKKEFIINNDRPFISENIINEPFEDDLNPLKPGNHLHFILPTQFTHFNSDGNNLPAPNRWLVNNDTNAWVVESDYLSKTTDGTQQSVTTLLPVTNANEPGFDIYSNNGNTYYQSFRYLGRQLSLEDWQHLGNSKTSTYWKDIYNEAYLTAFAHGDAQFPIYYPNCRSVWGFHDRNATKALQYNVVGWFHYDAEDVKTDIITPILSSIYTLISDVENDGTLLNSEDQVNAFFDRASDYGWNFTSENLGNPTSMGEIKDNFDNVDEIVLYGNTIENQQDADDNPTVKLAIGNTGVEALSAYLAAETYSDDTSRIQLENKLEAIQYDYLKGLTVDLGAKFQEARHDKGFKANSGSILWDYSFYNQTGKNSLSQDQTDTINTFIAEGNLDQLMNLLNVLNAVQAEYETATDAINSKQQQLFAYWYKYMMAAHPPVGQQDKYPNSDKILQFIRDYVISELDGLMEKTGVLTITESDTADEKEQPVTISTEISLESNGDLSISKSSNPISIYSPIAFPTDSGFMQISMATYLDKIHPAWNAWSQCLFDQLGRIYEEMLSLWDNDTLNQANLTIRLVQKPGPRYYQPTEPTLLIAGDVIPSDVNTSQEVLTSYIYSISSNDLDTAMDNYQAASSNSIPNNVQVYLDEVKPQSIDLPWHPNLMEWEVLFYPIEDSKQGDYSSTFLAQDFDLPSSQAEFELTSTGEATGLSSAVSAYRGFAHLSPHALTYLSNKLAPYSGDDSKDTELQDAYNQLQKEAGILSQGLSGFNQAFIMRKESLQLATIADPVAFDDYKELISTINEYISGNVGTAPIPTNGFNPIRGGGLVISKLNLINSFGQKMKVYEYGQENAPAIHAPQTMSLPSSVSSSITDKVDAFLYPRYVQSTRLHARWLTKDSTGKECGVHYLDTPICGWVVHNILDDSLMLYDYDGNLLGSIGKINDTIELIPKPEATSFSLDDIANQHLKSFANYFLEHTDGADYFHSFLILLSNAQEYIDPDTYAQHPELALLIGQPLALVRMRMNFELEGDYAYDESWSVLQDNMTNSKEAGSLSQSTQSYETVQIPVRLGDYQQLNDGLIGFWEDGDNQYMDVQSDFYSPATGIYSSNNQQTSATALPEYFTSTFLEDDVQSTAYQLSLNDNPQYFTMLFDPRAQLNISTGILPVKTIKIPSDLYKDSLEKIRVTFIMSPILTPKKTLQFPVPKVAGYQWKWIYPETFGTIHNLEVSFPAAANIAQSVLESQWEALNTGITDIWNKLSNYHNVEGATAVLNLIEETTSGDPLAYIYYNQVTSANLQLLLSISEDEADTLSPELMQLFLQYHQGIDAVVTGAQFNPVEIREGWLELLEQPSSTNS